MRDLLGGEDRTGLSDADIKDVLWDCHFNIEETVQWVIGAPSSLFSTIKSHFRNPEEQERNHQAQERKGKFPRPLRRPSFLPIFSACAMSVMWWGLLELRCSNEKVHVFSAPSRPSEYA